MNRIPKTSEYKGSLLTKDSACLAIKLSTRRECHSKTEVIELSADLSTTTDETHDSSLNHTSSSAGEQVVPKREIAIR